MPSLRHFGCLLLVFLGVTLSAAAQSTPPDEDGCVKRAIAEDNAATHAAYLRHHSAPRGSAYKASNSPNLSYDQEVAAIDAVQDKKIAACKAAMDKWLQDHANTVAAELAAAHRKNEQALLNYQQRQAVTVANPPQPANPATDARPADGHVPVWGFVYYDTRLGSTGAEMTLYISRTFDLATVRPPSNQATVIQRCSSSTGEGAAYEKMYRFDFGVSEWYLAQLQSLFGFYPEHYDGCLGYGLKDDGINVMRAVLRDQACSSNAAPIAEEHHDMRFLNDDLLTAGCTFQSRAQAEAERRRMMATAGRERIIEVNVP